jgi:toxin ParE1/3/4
MQIATYTLETWGEDQAVPYIDDVEESCRRLAENAHLGRACDYIKPGLRRMENGRHVVFYRTHAYSQIGREMASSSCRMLRARRLRLR